MPKILSEKILSEKRSTLKEVTAQYTTEAGGEITFTHEVYERGNAATILLYNLTQKTVVLVKQFRLPTYLNGNASGMLLECCAGMLEGDEPEACIRREATEETGYELQEVQFLFKTFVCPGSVTQAAYCFAAEITPEMRTEKGGGLEQENEHITVMEIDFEGAFAMIASGEIQDAKTMLLLQYARLNIFN